MMFCYSGVIRGFQSRHVIITSFIHSLLLRATNCYVMVGQQTSTVDSMHLHNNSQLSTVELIVLFFSSFRSYNSFLLFLQIIQLFPPQESIKINQFSSKPHFSPVSCYWCSSTHTSHQMSSLSIRGS